MARQPEGNFRAATTVVWTGGAGRREADLQVTPCAALQRRLVAMSCVGKIRTTHAVLSKPKRKRGWTAAHLRSKAAPTNSTLAAPSLEPPAVRLALPAPTSPGLPQLPSTGVNADDPDWANIPPAAIPEHPVPCKRTSWVTFDPHTVRNSGTEGR